MTPETLETPATVLARRITSNSRGPGQDSSFRHALTPRIPCLKCGGVKPSDGPHSPHWGTAPCGHMALVDCKAHPVHEVCDLCEQKPWPTPSLEHVEFQDARTGIALRCARCRSVRAFTGGSVEAELDAFEGEHLFCPGDA